MNNTGQAGPDTDAEWARLLSATGRLATELYGLSFTAPLHRFQHLALSAVRAVLAFDGAAWEFGVAGQAGRRCHSVFHFGKPATECNDCVRTLACRPTPEGTVDQTTVAQEAKAVEEIVFRRAGGKTFSEPERLFIRALVPQLLDTWRMARQYAVQGDRRSNVPAVEALAICDDHGWLHTAGRQFAPLLRTEWPHWLGPELPANLLSRLAAGYQGGKVLVTAVAVNDLWLLTVRRRTPADRLTPRERDIARCFGRGLGYREVAEALCISPSTARNHLKNIYDKLEIRSKIELAGWLRQIERPLPGTERRSMDGA